MEVDHHHLIAINNVSIALVIAEVVLVGFGNSSRYFLAQVILLILSTAFFLFSKDFRARRLPPTEQLLSWVFNLDDLFELLCFICGWALLFWRPGVAVLRCCRIFRYGTTAHSHTVRFFGRAQIKRISLLLRIAGWELLSGSVFPVIVFYCCLTIIVAASLYGLSELHFSHESYFLDTRSMCYSFSECCQLICRLSVLNSSGWEYLDFLLNSDHPWIAVIPSIYLVISWVLFIHFMIGSFADVVFRPSSDVDIFTKRQIKFFKQIRTILEPNPSIDIVGPSQLEASEHFSSQPSIQSRQCLIDQIVSLSQLVSQLRESQLKLAHSLKDLNLSIEKEQVVAAGHPSNSTQDNTNAPKDGIRDDSLFDHPHMTPHSNPFARLRGQSTRKYSGLGSHRLEMKSDLTAGTSVWGAEW